MRRILMGRKNKYYIRLKNKQTDEEDMYTFADAAKLLGTKPETLYKQLNRGWTRAKMIAATPNGGLYE